MTKSNTLIGFDPNNQFKITNDFKLGNVITDAGGLLHPAQCRPVAADTTTSTVAKSTGGGNAVFGVED